MGPLVCEQGLDKEPVVEWNVDDDSNRGCAVEIDLLSSDLLEEVAAEAVTANRADLNGLADGHTG